VLVGKKDCLALPQWCVTHMQCLRASISRSPDERYVARCTSIRCYACHHDKIIRLTGPKPKNMRMHRPIWASRNSRQAQATNNRLRATISQTCASLPSRHATGQKRETNYCINTTRCLSHICSPCRPCFVQRYESDAIHRPRAARYREASFVHNSPAEPQRLGEFVVALILTCGDTTSNKQ
jgi:hypothetical protein